MRSLETTAFQRSPLKKVAFENVKLGYMRIAVFTTLQISVCLSASALPVFPNAEGYGTSTPGGRGGTVCEVINTLNSGAGSLRDCMENRTGPRTIVFRQGGTIALNGPLILSGEAGSFVTIAAQTAPGGGVQLKNWGIQIRSGAHDVVIRYLRIRPGAGANQPAADIDAIEMWGDTGTPVKNVVIDHVSAEWSMDENISAWDWVTDVTIQNSIIGRARATGQNGEIAKGVLVGGDALNKPAKFSFHHNLFAHNADRNPKMDYVGPFDIRNNLIYNWGGNNIVKIGNSAWSNAGYIVQTNLVGNVFLQGANSFPDYLDAAEVYEGAKIFASGNIGPRCPAPCGWTIGIREGRDTYPLASETTYGSSTAFATAPVTTDSASELRDRVLAAAGATLPARDVVDSAIVNDVRNLTGVIDDNNPYPALAAGSAPTDTDHDGMPNSWELSRGLNPNQAADRNSDRNADGYTNLEEYLYMNLLTNEGFDSSVLTGWGIWSNVVLDSVNKRTGTNAVLIGTALGSGLYQNIVRTDWANRKATFSGYGKTSAAIGSGIAYIGLNCENSSGVILSSNSVSFTATTYTQKSISLTCPVGTALVKAYIENDSSTQYLYMDDMVVTRN